MAGALIELCQAKSCPHSRRVRQRLTELRLDVICRQVAPDPADREELERRSEQRSIPTLVFDDGIVVSGEEGILAALGRRFAEPSAAERHHREKAVEEWPEWSRLAPSD